MRFTFSTVFSCQCVQSSHSQARKSITIVSSGIQTCCHGQISEARSWDRLIRRMRLRILCEAESLQTGKSLDSQRNQTSVTTACTRLLRHSKHSPNVTIGLALILRVMISANNSLKQVCHSRGSLPGLSTHR